MFYPVSQESVNFLQGILGPNDRVLVTGAGGWFGVTIAAMLEETKAKSCYVTQRPREISWSRGSVTAIAWDWEQISIFSPTIIIDCAFILRDYLGDMPLERYISENQKLTSQMLSLTSLESVSSVIYVSSGAAIHPKDSLEMGIEQNPYGNIKRMAELALLSLGKELEKNTLVVRPFSLSGTLVTRPDRYAFSDLITQARSNEMRIASRHEVWRKYVSVEDFFAVSLAIAKHKSGYLNSGGELLEFSELANRINSALGLKVPVLRDLQDNLEADRYFSVDSSWQEACDFLGFIPANIDNQIIAVDRYLRSS